MTKTYTLVEKNGNGVLYLSALNEPHLDELVKDMLRRPNDWYIDGIDEVEDDE